MIDVLLGLAVLGSVTSQTLLDISMGLLFLHFLYSLTVKKVPFRKLIRFSGIEWAFLGYFVVSVVSLALNGKPPVPWGFYLPKFVWIINFYLCIYAFTLSPPDSKRYIRFFCWAFLLPNLYAISTYVIGYDWLTQVPIEHGARGLVNSATYHAHGNSLIFIFFLALLYKKIPEYNWRARFFMIMCISIFALSIFLTFTRGIWGALIISSLLLFWKESKAFALKFLLFLISACILLVATSPKIQKRLFDSFSSHSDTVRFNLLSVHFAMFKEHPWFGIGFWESYRQIADYWPKIGLPPDYYESHAHNQYINVLATTGVLGFIFFTAIWIFFLLRGKKLLSLFLPNSTGYIMTLAAFFLLVQFLLAGLTDVTFEYSKIRNLIVMAAALIVYLSLAAKERPR